ncbi:hypothetical protein GGQ68_003148 [Sagittula marina]|uniref:Uncharacterized protein n=1 Tax=Sagittula marina TaxID=943940 RepID=A0A7W6DUC0_9RHOB|nr:hypothetical protein [Sagittula marina]
MTSENNILSGFPSYGHGVEHDGRRSENRDARDRAPPPSSQGRSNLHRAPCGVAWFNLSTEVLSGDIFPCQVTWKVQPIFARVGPTSLHA